MTSFYGNYYQGQVQMNQGQQMYPSYQYQPNYQNQVMPQQMSTNPQMPQMYPNVQQYPAFPQNSSLPTVSVTGSMSGALPKKQHTESLNGFIPPAPAPKRKYLPPPKQPLKFPFKASNANAYAQIYAILKTMEILIDEYSNGNVSDSFYNQKSNELKKVFDTSLRVAGFSSSQLRLFAIACRLDVPLALDFLAPAAQQQKPKAQIEDARAFGEIYVTLQNALQIGPFTVENIQMYFIQFRMFCERLCPEEKRGTLNSLIQTCLKLFSKQKSHNIPPNDIQDLSREVQKMYKCVSS